MKTEAAVIEAASVDTLGALLAQIADLQKKMANNANIAARGANRSGNGNVTAANATDIAPDGVPSGSVERMGSPVRSTGRRRSRSPRRARPCGRAT